MCHRIHYDLKQIVSACKKKRHITTLHLKYSIPFSPPGLNVLFLLFQSNPSSAKLHGLETRKHWDPRLQTRPGVQLLTSRAKKSAFLKGTRTLISSPLDPFFNRYHFRGRGSGIPDHRNRFAVSIWVFSFPTFGDPTCLNQPLWCSLFTFLSVHELQHFLFYHYTETKMNPQIFWGLSLTAGLTFWMFPSSELWNLLQENLQSWE